MDIFALFDFRAAGSLGRTGFDAGAGGVIATVHDASGSAADIPSARALRHATQNNGRAGNDDCVVLL